MKYQPLTMQGPSSYPKDDALRTAQVKRKGREREHQQNNNKAMLEQLILSKTYPLMRT
jgi:hypothetical protein